MTEHRAWGGLRFARVASLEPKRGPDRAILEVMPQARYAKASTSVLNAYGAGPFCKFGIPWSFAGAGVYVITLDDRPLYVGECRHLAQRFNMGYGTIQPKNCYIGGQATNCKVNSKVLREVKDGRVPVLWFLETEDRHRVERELIAALRPAWNGRQ